MSDLIVEQKGNYICPSQNYTCRAVNIISMQWEIQSTDVSDPLQYTILDQESLSKSEIEIERGGIRVKFSRSEIVEGLTNISSSLFILDLTLNGTNCTCEISSGVGQNDDETVFFCIIGKHISGKPSSSGDCT